MKSFNSFEVAQRQILAVARVAEACKLRGWA